MQFTVSLAGAIAVIAWAMGAGLMSLAAFGFWTPGWIGTAPMILGNAAWMQGRMRREANRLSGREDAAFNFGRESAVRSIR